MTEESSEVPWASCCRQAQQSTTVGTRLPRRTPVATPPAVAALGSLAMVIASVEEFVSAQKKTTLSFNMPLQQKHKTTTELPKHAETQIARYIPDKSKRFSYHIFLRLKWAHCCESVGSAAQAVRLTWGTGALPAQRRSHLTATSHELPARWPANTSRIPRFYKKTSVIRDRYGRRCTLEQSAMSSENVRAFDETGMKLVIEHARGTQHDCTMQSCLHR